MADNQTTEICDGFTALKINLNPLPLIIVFALICVGLIFLGLPVENWRGFIGVAIIAFAVTGISSGDRTP